MTTLAAWLSNPPGALGQGAGGVRRTEHRRLTVGFTVQTAAGLATVPDEHTMLHPSTNASCPSITEAHGLYSLLRDSGPAFPSTER